MKKHSRIYIAGHTGLAGSAIVKQLQADKFSNIVVRAHKELDLLRQDKVEDFFKTVKPEYVFLAAAKVGGILANNTFPADFIYQNISIQTNIIHSAYLYGVKRLLFLGTSCIYPKNCPQPIKEEALLTDYLESSNEAYAIAKIAGIKMCESYNRQFNTHFMAIMPTNLYGPNDNFDPDTSHVLPALIHKFHQAKINMAEKVVIWGTGKPRREFLHVSDMARAAVFVMNLDDKTATEYFFSYPKPCFVNVGTGTDCTIKELAELIKEVVGYKGGLNYETTKPDGTPQKLLNISKLKNLGWTSNISLKDGVTKTYQWYNKHYTR
jgi:GDP-L-fucose synthase